MFQSKRLPSTLLLCAHLCFLLGCEARTELSRTLASYLQALPGHRLSWSLLTYWHLLSVPTTPLSFRQWLLSTKINVACTWIQPYPLQCISQTLVKAGFLKHIYDIILLKIHWGPKASLPCYLSSSWPTCYCLIHPTARLHALNSGFPQLNGGPFVLCPPSPRHCACHAGPI